MKVVNCTKCNEEYAVDLNKPEEWYCPYCDNLYSISTDDKTVEKLKADNEILKKALTEIKSDIHKNLTLDYNGTGWLMAIGKRIEKEIDDTLAAIGDKKKPI